MANIEHWIARNPADGIEVPIWQPEDVDTYEADGWRIAGPFVSAHADRGAVERATILETALRAIAEFTEDATARSVAEQALAQAPQGGQ